MTKKRFESFDDEEFQLLANTLPMLVSVTKNPDEETEEQFIATHDKFITLDEITKDKLAAPETATKIQSIGKSHNLVLVQTSDIARTIRNYYFGEIKLENFPAILSKEMGVNLETAQKISDLVIQKIINDDSQEKAHEAQLDKLSISVALEKYPAISEQLITSTHIKLKAYSEPVRPSIKNWLEDYTFTVGISNHDPIVRGDYLYKNENAIRLSNNDREKLSTILKSFEEKTPLTVNVNTKQIIFSAPERKEFPKNPLVDLSNMDSNAETAEINRSPKRTETAKESVLNLKNPPTPPEPPKKIQNQESYPQQRLAKLRQKAEPDAERLSAWRRDLPQKESPLYADKADKNVRFSSPQTLSTEKPTEKPKETPSISRLSFPQLASIAKTEPSTPKRPMPKNVVDLREE
jgi:hypothetical protein